MIYGTILPYGAEGHNAVLYANYTTGDSPEKSIRALFPKWPVNSRGKKEMTVTAWLEYREALNAILKMYLIIEDDDGWNATDYVIATDFQNQPYIP